MPKNVARLDLEHAVGNGAIGLKIGKNLSLTAQRFDGTRLQVDDRILDPIWEACARLDIPVIIHTAEPSEFFSRRSITTTNGRGRRPWGC